VAGTTLYAAVLIVGFIYPVDDDRDPRVPSGPINLFQLIYVLIRECEARSGLRALDLSLGNPDSIPADRVRELRAHHQRGERYELHAYAE
jgi:hypothetical protein